MVSVALLLVLGGALLLVVGRALLLLLRVVVGLEDDLALGLVPVVSEPGGSTEQAVQEIQDRGGRGDREDGQEEDRGEEVHLGVGCVEPVTVTLLERD